MSISIERAGAVARIVSLNGPVLRCAGDGGFSVNEAIEVGKGGDGHTTNYDARIIDSTHFELRSERQGGMDGRIYRVHFVDANQVPGVCEFIVPHSKSPHQGAVWSGTVVEILP